MICTEAPLARRSLDQAALQAAVDVTADELLVPGAVVILSTPGRVHGLLRYHNAGRDDPATGRHSLPNRLEYQDDDGRGDRTTGPGRSARSRRSGLEVRFGRARRRPDHHRRPAEDAHGLYNYTDAPEFSAILDRDPTKVWTPDEVLAIAFKHPPYFPPGTAFHYDNTNYALLGLIAEEREHGKPLARVLQDRLFGPLGMNDTALPASTSNTLPDPYSHGYMYGDSFFALVDEDYPPDIQAAARAGTLKPNDDTGQNPSYASAAGGVLSTTNDLVTWMRALVGGSVFNADYQHRWLDSLQPEDPSKLRGQQQYGYGIAQLSFGPNTLYFHGGEMPGYNSFMGYDPTNRLTLVVWTNLTVSPDGKPTANSIMLKVLVKSPLGQAQTSTPP